MQLYVDFAWTIEDIKFNAVFIDIAGKLVPYFVHGGLKPSQKNNAYINLEDVDTIEKASLLA
jgi:16S rRNA processing protein RimM